MQRLAIGVGIGALLVCFIYGSYWVAKTVSYSVFYEDMVQETIKESVKKSCLKN